MRTPQERGARGHCDLTCRTGGHSKQPALLHRLMNHYCLLLPTAGHTLTAFGISTGHLQLPCFKTQKGTGDKSSRAGTAKAVAALAQRCTTLMLCVATTCQRNPLGILCICGATYQSHNRRGNNAQGRSQVGCRITLKHSLCKMLWPESPPAAGCRPTGGLSCPSRGSPVPPVGGPCPGRARQAAGAGRRLLPGCRAEGALQQPLDVVATRLHRGER